MPEEFSKSSWAEEEGLEDFPPPVTKVDGNTKVLIEYSLNEDDQKVKITSYYKIEKHKVAKSIADRKSWKKFGLSKDDKPGPQRSTTIISEDIQMQFITAKEEDQNEQEELKKKLIDSQKGQVKCRLCKEDHWTKQCPYKDKLEPLRSSLLGEEKEEKEGAPTAAAAAPDKKAAGGAAPSKYVPPSMREGGGKKGESMPFNKTRDETTTVRVTNLSVNTDENDLQDLFGNFGDISRIYLAKHSNTNTSKGFAFINYKRREEAQRAIQHLHGHGYDHLILHVEWAKPSASN